MRRFTESIIITTLLFQTLACTSGAINYKGPIEGYDIKYTATFDQPKDIILQKIKSNIEKSSFTLESMDHKSGSIKLLYSGSAKEYMDCGIFESKTSDYTGKRSFVFQGSSDYAIYKAIDGINISTYRYQMSLESQITITVMEKVEDRSAIQVDARYLLTKKIKKMIDFGDLLEEVETISIGADEKGIFRNGPTCKSTGRMEKDVFELIK